jgi:hypothetical protein
MREKECLNSKNHVVRSEHWAISIFLTAAGLRSVVMKTVSTTGFTPADCRRFCAEKASDFNKSQQLSTSGVQQVQYQSVKNNKLQQNSIGFGIWFGTRGSEVQILSPRPFFSAAYSYVGKPKSTHLVLAQVL